MKRHKIDFGMLEEGGVKGYVFKMLDLESFAPDCPDVEIMRFTIRRIPDSYDIAADLVEWINTREINSRSVGVMSYFLCEYMDIFYKVDVDILMNLSPSLSLPAMECHHPDWLITALSFGAIMTKDERLISVVKGIDPGKIKSMNAMATSTYQSAMGSS